jgi:hypothetical protein
VIGLGSGLESSQTGRVLRWTDRLVRGAEMLASAGIVTTKERLPHRTGRSGHKKTADHVVATTMCTQDGGGNDLQRRRHSPGHQKAVSLAGPRGRFLRVGGWGDYGIAGLGRLQVVEAVHQIVEKKMEEEMEAADVWRSGETPSAVRSRQN